jgi:glycosyltransferase involved in cell wall biosynthesis
MLLRPLAFRLFQFRKYDLVISLTSAEAKGVRTRLRTKHVCYCHTPTRYLWSHTSEYRGFLEFGWLNWFAKLIIPPAFAIMRRWDKKAAQRPDIFIANSATTRDRIAEYYNRDSVIVYPFLPPRNISEKNKERRFFMCLGRVVPYKRFDIAIEACNVLGLPLRIFTSTHNAVTDKLQKMS